LVRSLIKSKAKRMFSFFIVYCRFGQDFSSFLA